MLAKCINFLPRSVWCFCFETADLAWVFVTMLITYKNEEQTCVLSRRASLRWAVPEFDSRGRKRRLWRSDDRGGATCVLWGFHCWLVSHKVALTCIFSLVCSQETSRPTGTAVSRWAPDTAAATATRAAWEDTVITVSVSSASHTHPTAYSIIRNNARCKQGLCVFLTF